MTRRRLRDREPPRVPPLDRALATTAVLVALTACGPAPSVTDAGRDAAPDGAVGDTVVAPDSATDAPIGPDSTPDDAATDAPGTLDAPSPGDTGPMGTPVAVALGYGARRARSTDGRAWTDFAQIDPNGGDDDNLFRGGAFIDGLFVGVGGSAHGLVMTSRDGRTWSMPARTARAWIGGVAGLGGALVAAGGNGLRARSRDMGASWTDDAGYQPVHYRAVAGNGGVVVAVGHSYGGSPDVGVIAATTDGVRWTEAMRGGATLHSMAYGNGVFVAAGDSGRIVTSTNGTTWTDRPALDGTQTYAVGFANGEFIAAGASVYRSHDGASWTRIDGVSRGAVGGFGGLYVSFGWPATIEVSSDLRAWDRAFAPGGPGFTTLVVGVVP